MDQRDEPKFLAAVRGVRVTCRTCGVLRLGLDQIGVRACLTDGTVAFHFRCPQCRLRETGVVCPEAVELMRASGVTFTPWRHPSELSEPHTGAAISCDEVTEACAVLADDARFAEVVDELRRRCQP